MNVLKLHDASLKPKFRMAKVNGASTEMMNMDALVYLTKNASSANAKLLYRTYRQQLRKIAGKTQTSERQRSNAMMAALKKLNFPIVVPDKGEV